MGPITALAFAAITTIAGTGSRGYSGDGGPATQAALSLANVEGECIRTPLEQGSQMTVDRAGNLYIADGANHRIRRVDHAGIISTVAGDGQRPAIGESCQPLEPVGNRLYNPSSVAVLSNGDLIIADQQNNRIRKLDTRGLMTTIVGNGMHNPYAQNIPATSSPMDWPAAVAVDAAGAVYFSEVHSHRVARIGADGRIVTIAGTGFPGFNGDGRRANTATLRSPMGIAVDAAGNVYIADRGNHLIRKVSTDGMITTVAGGDPNEKLNSPMDVKVDSTGRVYIADTLNHKVKRVNTNGSIETIAGDGVPGILNAPAGLAIDSKDDVYIADWQNYRIRKVAFGFRVVNAATFSEEPLAPGAIVSIVGLKLAQTEGVSVEVNGRPIPLFYVGAEQINAHLPSDLTGDSATLALKAGGAVTEHTIAIAPSSPGIYQLDAEGRAAALNQDGSINAPANPEIAGNVIVVFLNGLGAVTPGSDLLERATQSVSATIGGIDAAVFYAGMTPGSIGLAQINIRIPAGVPAGAKTPLAVKVGEKQSNTVTISVR